MHPEALMPTLSPRNPLSFWEIFRLWMAGGEYAEKRIPELVATMVAQHQDENAIVGVVSDWLRSHFVDENQTAATFWVAKVIRRRGGRFFVAAAADLTGDGIVDFIVGRDRGRTVVETFNGATGALLSTITPFATRYALGARVAAADVNLDGIADIIVGSGGRNAGSVKFFDGVTNAEMTARTISAFPTFPNGAVFVAGSSPVPRPQLT